MSEHDVEAKSSDTNNGSDQASGNSGGCDADTRYIRSLEGITKIVCVPLDVIGLILTANGFIRFGGWYIFSGVGFIFYIVVVLVVETFIPNYWVHRLIDAAVMGVYALLWGLTAIANLALGIQLPDALVGIGTIFSAALCGLCVAGTIFAIMTYKKNDNKGWAPSQPIIGNKD